MARPPYIFTAGDNPQSIGLGYSAWGVSVRNLSAQWLSLGYNRWSAPTSQSTFFLDGEEVGTYQWAAPPGVIQPASVAGQIAIIAYTAVPLQDSTGAIGGLAASVAGVTQLERFAKAGIPAVGSPGRLVELSDYDRSLWMELASSSQFVSITGEIFNVKFFGAKGDGLTDDTAAIQNAINTCALTTAGGIVFFPLTANFYKCASGLTLNGKRNVTLMGPAFNSGAVPYGAEVRYTGAGAGSFIDAGASYGIQLKRLFISYSDATYTGRVVDFRGTVGVSTQWACIDECAVYGNGGRSAQACVDLDRVVTSRITNSFFLNAKLGIQGGINYANQVLIQGCSFHFLTTVGIRDLGESWNILSNTFASTVYNAGLVGPAGAIDFTAGSVKPRGISIIGNWFGDLADPGSGTHIKVWGNGYTIMGNTMNLTTGVTGIAFAQNSNTGIVIMGNTFERNGAGGANPRAIDFGVFTGQTGIHIGPNDVFGTLTEVTGFNPANGIWFNTAGGQIQLGRSFFDVALGLYVAGGGTPLTQVAVYAPNLTPAALAVAIGAQEQTFAVAGLNVADKLIVNGPAPAALAPLVHARVSAADTLALTFDNSTVAANVPAAGVYNVVAIRS